jgi:hypothetical protein
MTWTYVCKQIIWLPAPPWKNTIVVFMHISLRSYFIFTSLVCCNLYETIPIKLLYGFIVYLVCYMFWESQPSEFIFVLYSHGKNLLLVTVLDAVIYTSFLLHVTLYMHGAPNIIFSYRSTVRSHLPPTTRFVTQYDYMPNIIYSFPSLLVVHIQEQQMVGVLYFSIPNYCLCVCVCTHMCNFWPKINL